MQLPVFVYGYLVYFVHVNGLRGTNLFAQAAETAKFHIVFKMPELLFLIRAFAGLYRKVQAGGRAYLYALPAFYAFLGIEVYQAPVPLRHLQFLRRVL